MTSIPNSRFHSPLRGNINPIRNLTPQSLVRILDSFYSGNLSQACLAWDAIERRDDTLKNVASKRKKAISRLHWNILTVDDSPEALEHKAALEYFYNNLTATDAFDGNQHGAFSLLIKQMMDSVGKKYAVHEIIYNTNKETGKLTANFRFIPLWFFENKTGKLRFLKSDTAQSGIDLEEGSWLVTTGDGLMEPCSIAYLFKQLPLKDWLIYCERNGMPGVKGTTDAIPGTTNWESARSAVLEFGAEFHALLHKGTDIQAIDLTAKGELPYPGLIERMDRAMTALWRGSDLATISRDNAVGASLQSDETAILEQDDAAHISETLNIQVDRFVLKYLFGVERGKAYIRINSNNHLQTVREIEILKQLWDLGLSIPENQLRERFGITKPTNNEPTLTKNN